MPPRVRIVEGGKEFHSSDVDFEADHVIDDKRILCYTRVIQEHNDPADCSDPPVEYGLKLVEEVRFDLRHNAVISVETRCRCDQ